MTRTTNADPFGFANAINDDVIDNLTPAQIAAIEAIFDKEDER